MRRTITLKFYFKFIDLLKRFNGKYISTSYIIYLILKKEPTFIVLIRYLTFNFI